MQPIFQAIFHAAIQGKHLHHTTHFNIILQTTSQLGLQVATQFHPREAAHVASLSETSVHFCMRVSSHHVCWALEYFCQPSQLNLVPSFIEVAAIKPNSCTSLY